MPSYCRGTNLLSVKRKLKSSDMAYDSKSYPQDPGKIRWPSLISCYCDGLTSPCSVSITLGTRWHTQGDLFLWNYDILKDRFMCYISLYSPKSNYSINTYVYYYHTKHFSAISHYIKKKSDCQFLIFFLGKTFYKNFTRETDLNLKRANKYYYVHCITSPKEFWFRNILYSPKK